MLVAVVALAAIAGVVVWRVAARRPPVRLASVEIHRGTVRATTTATGTLSATVTVQVGTQVSGTIAVLDADFNSVVKKGQRVAKIDPKLFEAAVEQARANLDAARATVAQAKAQAADARRQYERSAALAARQLVALADRDTLQATADADDATVVADEAAVDQAKAALRQAELNLANTDILSPTDGVVVSRNVDVGQTVAASLQAPTLFVIAGDLTKMQVDTSVAEGDVAHVRDGMPVTFTVDAYAVRIFHGVVRQVRNSAQTVQNVVTYDAVIDVDNPDLRLLPGMTADVTFVYQERNDVLRVPNPALRFRPPPELAAGEPHAPPDGAQAGRRVVWRVRGTRAEPVWVRTGLSDGSFTEIAEGDLREGDVVATGVIEGSDAASPGGAPSGPRVL